MLFSFDPELLHRDTESAIKSNLIDLLTQLKDFTFLRTLVSVFEKIESENKTKYANKTKYTKIHKYLGKGSGWIIDSVIDPNISISDISL